MAAAADVLIRAAFSFAAAFAAFALALLAVHFRAPLAKRSVLIAAALYWPLFAADLAPLVWSIFGGHPSSAFPVTAALYALALAGAVVAARRGHARAVVAALCAVIGRWIIYNLFAAVYAIALK